MSRPNQPPCPECGEDELDCDEADVGVGIIYGPSHCGACGWSELGDVEERNRNAPPGKQVQADGSIIDIEADRAYIRGGLEKFGLGKMADTPMYHTDKACRLDLGCMLRDGHGGECIFTEPAPDVDPC